MITDLTRDLYADALKRRIDEQSRVLDIGSGTGYFALLALSLGAKKVYAVEPDIGALQWIEPCRIENGVDSGRLKAICKRIEQVTFDDLDRAPIDLIVSDTRGVIPENLSIQMIVYARQFIKPKGEVISKKDHLFVAPIESPFAWLQLSKPWNTNGVRGVKLTSCFNACLDSPHKTSFRELDLLADPSLLDSIDYEIISMEDASNIKGYLSFEPRRTGILHGFALWFDSDIDESNYISNTPGKKDSVLYRQLFFPLRTPCVVEPGYRIFCNFSMRKQKSGEYDIVRFVRNGTVLDADSRMIMSFEQECRS